jgi:hypothetical protein
MIASEVRILPSDFTPVTSSDYSTTKDSVTVSVVGSTVTADQMRIFKGKTITISSEKDITSIVFVCTANGTNQYGPGCFAEQEGYTYEAQGKTGTWLGITNSITFTASSNQVRVTQILIMFNTPTDTTSQDTTIVPSVYTPLDTITCDSARIAALANVTDSAIVKGYVTDTVLTSKGVHYFWMADSVNGGHVFEAYNVTHNPNVGDLIWIKGKLTKYGTTPEMSAPEFGVILPAEVDTTSQDTITPVVPESIMAPGENANNATVNDKPAVKVGTSKKVGNMTITVPSNATKLTLYAAAWKAEDGTEITITPRIRIVLLIRFLLIIQTPSI